MTKIATRFAPSPTGPLHIGGVRTALFNWLYSKNKKGTFHLRIEDTDKERSKEEYKNQIIKSLKWIGIEYDGNEYIQSIKIDDHIKIVKELLKNDIDTIIDDTDENFSSKIKKMNLIGAPYQILLGKKSDGDLLEFKEIGGETQNLPLNKIIEIITKQKNSI